MFRLDLACWYCKPPEQPGTLHNSNLTRSACYCGALPYSDTLDLTYQVTSACNVQVFGGVVYLDVRTPSSRASRIEPSSHKPSVSTQDTARPPVFKYLPAEGLPPLYLIYVKGTAGKESGKVHAPVKQRFLDGEPQVQSNMLQQP